jgi:hypothetical protein
MEVSSAIAADPIAAMGSGNIEGTMDVFQENFVIVALSESWCSGLMPNAFKSTL